MAAHIERLTAARGDPAALETLLHRSPVPTVLLDDERHYIDANQAARTFAGRDLDELRQMRIDDLSPPSSRAALEAGWAQLLETGFVVGEELEPEGTYMGIITVAVANVLPGRHVVAFAPPDWHAPVTADIAPDRATLLTPRELEVLQLAAGGLNGPAIAEHLVLTQETVRTHFANIYRKLDVSGRAAAVAKALRLGLIE